MPLTRETLERQYAQSQARLDKAVAELKESGIAEAEMKRQPKWKHANADRRAIKKRLAAVTEKESITAAAAEYAASKE